ncbi:MAG: transglycosylase SLT domain-containing protein [Rhodomicrobium sp.]
MGAPKAVIAIVLSMFSPLFSAVAEAGQEVKLCEREMSQAAIKYGVPLGILFAVGLTETGIDGSLHAYALNLEGNTVYSLSKTQAVERFNAAKAGGMKLIDVGCMQLNYYFHGDRFSSVEDMLDPHKNVDYAARFLSGLRAREGSWTMAVARYNAGRNNDPGQRRYVCRVLERLVKSGFGAWTANSAAFCEGELQRLGEPPAKHSGQIANSLAQAR